ncbi:hypothetical protein BLNAU_12680 [Blattamonas nauphoetae]|uniref:Uncharacterized protein n=1 Tax=Blattamonas nauphoetae TaxID=2049346 RepID=A0ABQ9XJ16_9EUKA|nr:hypothetical protein BLNAU_12680 [Blattamonas nauphoetae]
MPLVNLFRSVIVRNPLFHHVLQKITDSMLILIDVYESTFVYSIPPNVKDSDYTLEIFFLAALNLLDAMTGGETFDKVFTGALPKLTNLLVRCMQIPRLSILQWQESIDNYLRDESEDLVKATVRSVSRIVFMELFSLCLHHDDYDVMVQTKKPKQKKKAPIPTPFESDELRMNVSKNRRELETLNQINLLAGSVSDLNSFSDMVRMEACVTAAASIADIRFNEAEDEDDALLNYLMGMPMQRGGQKSSCPWDAQTFTSPFLQQLARPGIETDESELAPLCSSLLVLIGKASSQLPPETISTYLQRIIELLNQRPADQPQTSEIVRVSAHKTIQMISHSVDPSLIAPFFVPLMHAIYAYITAPSSETSGVFDGDEPMVLAETILGLIRAGQGQITGVAKTILDLVILLFDKSANNSFIIGILADIVQLLNDSKEPNLIFEVQAYLLPQLFTRINYVTSGQAQAEGVNIEPGVVEGLLNIVRLTFRESSQTQPFPPGGPNDGHYNTMYTMVDAILPKQDLATIDPARVDGGSLSEASEILCDLVRLAPHLICSPAGEIDQAKVNFIYQFSVFMFSPVVSETAALHVGVLLRTFLWTFWDHLSSDIKQSIASVVIHKFFVCRQANFAVTLLPVIVFFTRRIPDDFFALIANVQLPPDLPTQITNPPITWSPLSLFINNWCQLQTEVRGDFDIRASLHALQSIVQRIPDSRGMLVAGPIIPTAMPTTRSKSKTNPDQHSVITLLTRVTQLTIEVFSEEELNQAKIRKPVNLNEEDDDDDGEEDEDEDEDDIDSYIANLGGVGSNPIKTGVSQTDVDALIQSDPLAQMNTMVLCCQFMLEMRGVMEENSIQLRPEETKTVGRMVQFLAMTQSN